MFQLDHPYLLHQLAYINGEWVGAVKGEVLSIHNPSDQSYIGSIPSMGRVETEQAISVAYAAWKPWREKSPWERSKILYRWYELILENLEDLAKILTAEQGKPLPDARSEIQYGASFVEWFAAEAKRINGDIIAAPRALQRIMVLKQPIGVIGAITPWNFPNAMVTRKCAPALAAGCTVVIKPSELTTFSALALADLAGQAGIPAGVFNVVTGNPEDIGRELTRNPLVRKIDFTGSTRVGKLLMQQSAETVKKLSLELGGNAPFIVFEDADLEAAVQGALTSKFRNSGQACTCSNRFLIHTSLYERFAEKMIEAVKNLKLGDGFEPGAQQGPLINLAAVKKVEGLIADACAQGAEIRCGGQRHILGENFFQPTVITEMNASMRMAKEEIFGPVAALYRFETEEEAIEMANATNYGLACYLFSRDINRVWRVSEQLEYGMVAVNSGFFASEALPFGGIKESGMGREGSKYGIDEFLEMKSIAIDLSLRV